MRLDSRPGAFGCDLRDWVYPIAMRIGIPLVLAAGCLSVLRSISRSLATRSSVAGWVRSHVDPASPSDV